MMNIELPNGDTFVEQYNTKSAGILPSGSITTGDFLNNWFNNWKANTTNNNYYVNNESQSVARQADNNKTIIIVIIAIILLGIIGFFMYKKS